ncbi:MAG: hypothetical protein SWH54_18630 [Thermodesulfobacteriota bacterium]|nr:hypothetical protein [Thermodesulfobacteriota bacterium]
MKSGKNLIFAHGKYSNPFKYSITINGTFFLLFVELFFLLYMQTAPLFAGCHALERQS